MTMEKWVLDLNQKFIATEYSHKRRKACISVGKLNPATISNLDIFLIESVICLWNTEKFALLGQQ